MVLFIWKLSSFLSEFLLFNSRHANKDNSAKYLDSPASAFQNSVSTLPWLSPKSCLVSYFRKSSIKTQTPAGLLFQSQPTCPSASLSCSYSRSQQSKATTSSSETPKQACFLIFLATHFTGNVPHIFFNRLLCVSPVSRSS